MEGFALNFGCSVVRRQVFDEIGFLDPAVRHEGDADWFMRARERGVPIAVVDAVTLIYRRHEDNMTLQPDLTLRSSLETLKRSLDRRRAAGVSTSLPRWTTLMRRDQ
jgi:GT2 family glycosyltransferase